MIRRLSEMSVETRKEFDAKYEEGIAKGSLCNPAAEFNEWGLRFSAEYLTLIGKYIVFLPLEIMAEYVDVITKRHVDENDEEFFRNNVINEDINVAKAYDNLNATSIGNFAYVALNCKNEKAQQYAEKTLGEILVLAEQKVIAEMTAVADNLKPN